MTLLAEESSSLKVCPFMKCLIEVKPAYFSPFFIIYNHIASDLLVMVDHNDVQGRTKAEVLTFLRSKKKVNEATVFGVVKHGSLASTVSTFAYP